MIVKLLTEHQLEFLSLKGGCRGSSESTHVKSPHCWKSHALAHYYMGGQKPMLCLAEQKQNILKTKSNFTLFSSEYIDTHFDIAISSKHLP